MNGTFTGLYNADSSSSGQFHTANGFCIVDSNGYNNFSADCNLAGASLKGFAAAGAGVGDPNLYWNVPTSGVEYHSVAASAITALQANGYNLGSGKILGWSSTSTAGATADTDLSRLSPGVIAAGTGAAGSTAGTFEAQSFLSTTGAKLVDAGGGYVNLSLNGDTSSSGLNGLAAGNVGTGDPNQYWNMPTGGVRYTQINAIATEVTAVNKELQGSGGVFGWGSSSTASTTADTGLSRDPSEGAGVVDVGNGTAGNASGKIKAAAITDSTLTSGLCTMASTGGLLANGPGPCGIGLSIPLGTATFTPGTNVTSAACASGYTCTNTRGEITLVGGTATTGTIATVNFSAGLSAAPFCSISLNGSGSTGTAGFDLGHGTPGTTNFTITAGLSVVGATLNIDYSCVP